MNLFLLGWDTGPDIAGRAINELRAMCEVYPQLAPDTCRQVPGRRSDCWAASITTPPDLNKPRRYRWQEGEDLVLFDGVPIDGTGEFFAQDARELTDRWDCLPDRLTGPFVAARLTAGPPRLELITDDLGIGQVYYGRCDRGWLISNSVRPIARLFDWHALDETGICLFLSQGFVWRDRTLCRGVRTIPAASRWTFRPGEDGPVREVYCPVSSLAPRRRRRPSPPELDRIAGRLAQPCRALGQWLGPMICPLTGGRDSRLVAALAGANCPVTYFTTGGADDSDVRVAREVAARLGLPHEVRPAPPQDVLKRWEEYCRRLVAQGDGMISLWLLRSMQIQPTDASPRETYLSGMGGEIARGYFYRPIDAARRPHRPNELVELLADALIYKAEGLLRPVVTARALEELGTYVERALEDGLRSLDVLDAFYTYQRVGRWGGGNRRTTLPFRDVFAPLSTRTFLEAALALPVGYRCNLWLHRNLMRRMEPELERIPFDHGAWPPESPAWNLACWGAGRVRQRLARRFRWRPGGRGGQGWNAPVHAQWLEAKLDWARSLCLDQKDSPLWDYVDPNYLETLLATSTDPRRRRAYGPKLYDILTLFLHTAQTRGR